MPFAVSADTGGTFIDVVVRDENNDHYVGKALTTHNRVFDGMRQALERIGEDLGVSAQSLLADTDLFIYGTTRATNAIVTRTVAKTALLTTEGFPDILVLKEGGKRDVFDYTTEYPDPYIPRRRTFEVPERVSSEAQITKALDEDAVRSILNQLREENYEAVAVCLLWSVVQPAHELRIAELIEELLPGIPYTLSHQIAPIVREYRRASATAIDASLKPLMQSHFRQLEADLRDFGYPGQLLVSSSIGGVMTVEEMIAAPINAAKSGPAMAPVAAITFSTTEGFGGDTIVCDTGGTTFDVGLSRNSELIYTRETWLGDEWEGDLLGISSVDIRSIGSGGGSIAWVDEGGLLRVGPHSAGSEPGPACYGRGGTDATLSDAACVLGFFDPDYFLGGRMDLDSPAAREAVDRVARKLGRGADETAWGILTLATDQMVKAVYDMTISQGLDPKESTVVAGGGAAGINIMQIAAELGSKRVILPKTAGALSASGMHFADIVKEEAAPVITRSAAFDLERVNEALGRLEDKLAAFATRIGLSEKDYRIECFTEARYEAQVWDIVTPLPVSRFQGDEDVAQLRKAFDDEHERLFAFRDDTAELEFISWKARLTAHLDTGHPPAPKVSRTHGTPSKTRGCYFGHEGWIETPVYLSEDLRPGQQIAGPAIIQEPTTTLVVYPGMATEVSGSGNYVLHVVAPEGSVY
ncbi:hydantoinase/oxoprolinase family protein [Saccharopolyspora pogona]|uniref:hydantoinase/oxoprolinase family protein n=1 Tax=Saccharopolyspora pogona TaxID=333966 RepID=UPI001688B592|nr:hydantoinase/oxoprolinase family protein [Saccharopolyspora pogona]